jgi:branched-chain amino acid transport system ATP-binding protein
MTALLRVQNVSRSFGGVEAVRALSLEVARGELVGLIGPNGAGKTTLVNLISSHQRPSAGAILLDSQPIHRLPVFRTAQLGIARTYQQTRLFLEDSVIDNIRTGLVWARAGTREGLSYPGCSGHERQRLEALIAFFGLEPYRDAMPGELSHMLQRRVEIAQALALAPKLLLLDEPFAGFSREEAAELITLLRACQQGGLTILLIDHNMEIVMQVCERLFVMHHGALLATGTPAEVRANRDVVGVYLGGEL